MAETPSAQIVALDRGYVCSHCRGYVRPDAQLCKHCRLPFDSVAPAPMADAVPEVRAPWSIQLRWALLWGLVAGSIAAVRAGVIMLGLVQLSSWSRGDWATIGIAAGSAFVTVTTGMWVLCLLPVATHTFTRVAAGVVLAVLPHPLFWWCLYAYTDAEPISYTVPGGTTVHLGIWMMSLVGLMVVGWLTIPLSLLSTFQVWHRYRRRVV